MFTSVPNDRRPGQGDPAPVTVLIADPHPGSRSAIRNALMGASTVTVVGEASDLPSAINAVAADRVDIVLADARVAGIRSESARAGLEELSRRTPVIVMGMSDPRVYTAPLQAAGAAGYWPKDGDIAQLTGLLDAASHRQPVTGSEPPASAASEPPGQRAAPRRRSIEQRPGCPVQRATQLGSPELTATNQSRMRAAARPDAKSGSTSVSTTPLGCPEYHRY